MDLFDYVEPMKWRKFLFDQSNKSPSKKRSKMESIL